MFTQSHTGIEGSLSAGFAMSYRFGFNGQEKDNEVGQGVYTAENWEYDSRIGRRWNLDPKPTVGLSDYACFANNPISLIDPKGSTVTGADSASAAQPMSSINDAAGGNSSIMSNFKVDDNFRFGKVDINNLEKSMTEANISNDRKNILLGWATAINSDKDILVFAFSNGNTDRVQELLSRGYSNEANTINAGIANGQSIGTNNEGVIGWNNSQIFAFTSIGNNMATTHEILGEALFRIQFGETSLSKYNSTDGQLIFAMQVENQYRRFMGIPLSTARNQQHLRNGLGSTRFHLNNLRVVGINSQNGKTPLMIKSPNFSLDCLHNFSTQQLELDKGF
jgi:RHS repeat-associated protein